MLGGKCWGEEKSFLSWNILLAQDQMTMCWLWMNLYFLIEDSFWVSEEERCEELIWSQKWSSWACFRMEHHGHVRGRTGEGTNREKGWGLCLYWLSLVRLLLVFEHSGVLGRTFLFGFTQNSDLGARAVNVRCCCCCWGIQRSLSAYFLVLLCLNLCGGLNNSRK